MKMLSLYDNAGTMFAVPPNFLQDGITFAQRYVSDDERVSAMVENFTARMEKRVGTTPQDLFDLVCDAFVEAEVNGEHEVSGKNLLYLDSIVQLKRDADEGRNSVLLTSGTPEYTRRFLDFDVEGRPFREYIDAVWSGSEVGDKDCPETYGKIWEDTKGGVYALFDDKLSVCQAASTGFKSAGGNPYVFLVDRKGKYTETEELTEFLRSGGRKIQDFSEV